MSEVRLIRSKVALSLGLKVVEKLGMPYDKRLAGNLTRAIYRSLTEASTTKGFVPASKVNLVASDIRKSLILERELPKEIKNLTAAEVESLLFQLGVVSEKEDLVFHYEKIFKFLLKLSLSEEKNREITSQALREAFSWSGVRAYTVNRETREWFHKISLGEKTDSSYVEPMVPPFGTEKSFVTAVMRNEFEAPEFKVIKSPESNWMILHIESRKACSFISKAQIEKDEAYYGRGMVDEIMYLIVGGIGDRIWDVYMVTNWTKNSEKGEVVPLLREKEDLVVLSKFLDQISLEKRLAEEVRAISVYDELTGAYNKRYFGQKLERELIRAGRYGRPMTLAMIDVDHFKRINDKYGHLVGDRILKEVARILMENLRKDVDVVVRYGGDEFAIILPETNEGGLTSKEVLERVRKIVEEEKFEVNGDKIKVTISVGIAAYPSHADKVLELIDKADRALYLAKDSGGNCVKIATS